MAQYDYQCKICKEKFSISAKMGTVQMKKLSCPHCKSNLIKRLWFPISVHYHGSGFTKGIKDE